MFISAGCKLDMTTDLYVSDLREVSLGSTTELTTPATIAIGIPAANECQKYAAILSDMMQGILTDFSPKGCERDGMNSYLLANVQLPLVKGQEVWRQAGSLFGIMTTSGDGHIGVALVMNLKKYETLNEKIEDRFHQKLDLSTSKITVFLNNDERVATEYIAGGVFLNGQPVYENENFTLERRHKVEIKLSNVRAAYLEKYGYVLSLILKSVS